MPVSGLLGRKVGMTTVFSEEGQAIPVTVIAAGPCTVTQLRTIERDGYRAVQLGFEDYPTPRRREGGNVPRGRAGHRAKGQPNRPTRVRFEKIGIPPKRVLQEFALTGEKDVAVRMEIKVADLFKVGDRVKVQGTSKGRGFAGVIRRHHFHGQPASHGSKIHRKPASIGDTNPARVIKGKRMPGHMGNEKVTVRNLQVVEVDAERNLLLVRGAVPGARGGLLRIERD
ncbi:MAG: 50S ribosomal protein L3 [Abditibacteriales bacterium]|nr:50S ribosomal protein L3 [Abditibacteriales bacterium]